MSGLQNRGKIMEFEKDMDLVKNTFKWIWEHSKNDKIQRRKEYYKNDYFNLDQIMVIN